MADTTALKGGAFIRFKDKIYAVTEHQHVNPGKGSAFVRTKLKDVATGKTLEHTFKVSESIDLVDMDRAKMQFLYKDNNGYNFMDNKTYEQISLSEEMLGEMGSYLKEGVDVSVMSHEGTPLSIELPIKITLEVTESMPAVKGDTASGNVQKEVTLETGKKINVPLFVGLGDKIVINTEKGEYVERAK